jgi:cation transporter-like permease
MKDRTNPASNGSKPDLSQSRFFCNNARKGSLVCAIVAFVALVIGGGFAEISSSGSPTSLETAAVRWVIVGSLVMGVALYAVGGRMLRSGRGESPGGRSSRP